MEIEEFIKSQDYRDICYLIDHIDDQDIFNSCVEELGYKVGVDIFDNRKPLKLKAVYKGDKGEFRVVSFIKKETPIAESVIIKNDF